jgi:hypothetical protein
MGASEIFTCAYIGNAQEPVRFRKPYATEVPSSYPASEDYQIVDESMVYIVKIEGSFCQGIKENILRQWDWKQDAAISFYAPKGQQAQRARIVGFNDFPSSLEKDADILQFFVELDREALPEDIEYTDSDDEEQDLV